MTIKTKLNILLFMICVFPHIYSYGQESEIPIREGDQISVAMVEDPDIIYQGVVNISGYIQLPYIQDFKVVGLTPSKCADALSKTLTKDLYQKATIKIHVVKRAPGVVYVYGAVKQPGPVSLPDLGHLSVLQAISRVGGTSAWASPKECKVSRNNLITGKRERMPIDLVSALENIGGTEDLNLVADDVIFVPATNTELAQFLSHEPFEVIIVGQVNQPGITMFVPGEQRTFMRAIFKAGNFTRFAKKKAVRIINYSQNNEREVKTVNAERIIDEGFLEDDFELQAGDMIIVDEKLINF